MGGLALVLKDIAEQTGLSVSTISLALKGDERVAEKTRLRVLRVAQGMGYEPHGAGRALATGRTRMIGFVAGEYVASAYWNTGILSGLTHSLDESGYRVVFFEAEPWSIVTPEMLRRRMVDGLVMSSIPFDPKFVTSLTEQAIPVVVADPLMKVRCDSVELDDKQGARVATKHLLDLGHRRIAYIGGSPTAKRIHEQRWLGFVAEMSEAGLPVNPGGERTGEGEALVREVLEVCKPTALLCFSDAVAASAIQELGACQARVPEDVSVVGIDDGDFARFLNPPLTTVRVPFSRVGATAARLLLERLDAPELGPRRVVLEEDLVVRASTAPPKSESGG